MKYYPLLPGLILLSMACNLIGGGAPPPAPTDPPPPPTPPPPPPPRPAGPTNVSRSVPAGWRDYGDAPDGGETTYAGGVAVGSFPTASGPSHSADGRFWLGTIATAEETSAPVEDPADDGMLQLNLNACQLSQAFALVNVSGLAADERQGLLYLNMFFDWNRDGNWEGEDVCSMEWAVQNYPISLADWSADSTAILAGPQFVSGAQTGELWYRISLTETPVPESMWQEERAFEGGETEDYLHVDETLAAGRGSGLAAPAFGAPPAPTFACPGRMIHHAAGTFHFTIEQTAESRGRQIDLASVIIDIVGPTAPKGVAPPSATNIGLFGKTAGDGRATFDVEVTLGDNEDEPDRVEGPFTLIVKIGGAFGGAKQGTFDLSVACTFYISHTNPPFTQSAFAGAPDSASAPRGSMPQVETLVAPHGKKLTLQPPLAADRRGKYDASTVKLYIDDGSGVAVESPIGHAGLAGVQVDVPSSGRGLRIETPKDEPPRTDTIIITISGADAAGQPVTDIFRVMITHCAKAGRGGGGLARPALESHEPEVCGFPGLPGWASEENPADSNDAALLPWERFASIPGNVEHCDTGQVFSYEPQADIIGANITPMGDRTLIEAILSRPPKQSLMDQYSWATLLLAQTKDRKTHGYVLETLAGAEKIGEIDPRTGDILIASTAVISHTTPSEQSIMFNIPIPISQLDAAVLQGFNTPTMADEGNLRCDNFQVPFAVTGDTFIAYNGPQRAAQGQTLITSFFLRDLLGAPLSQGQLAASLGDPPTRSDASHNRGEVGANGMIDLPLDVRLGPGMSRLFISWEGEVFPISEINIILPP